MGEELVRNMRGRLTVDNAKYIAEEALASTKSAHHRLNKIDKMFGGYQQLLLGLYFRVVSNRY